MSNEPLFHKIKSELENLRPAYDPADWDQMEQMLDKDKRLVPMWAWRAAAGVALVLAATFGYFYFIQQDDPQVLVQSNTATWTDLNLSAAGGESANTASQVQNDQTNARDEKTAQHNSRGIAAISSNDNAGERNEGEAEMTELSAIAQESNAGNRSASNADNTLPPAGELLLMDKKEMAFIEQNNQQLPASNDLNTSPDKKRSTARYWAGPSVKPSVQIVTQTQASFAEGVIAGVDVNDRVGIEAGVFYEEMKYNEKPAASFTINEAHVGSKGNFKGFSIPVRATYRFRKGHRLQPTVQAGLTAFVPIEEEYVFEYSQANTKDGNFANSQASHQTMAVERDTITITTREQSFSSNQKAFESNASNQYAGSPSESSKLYMMASAGAGMRYYVSPKLSLHVSANYVQPLSDMGIEQRSLRQVDLGVGMQYYLN